MTTLVSVPRPAPVPVPRGAALVGWLYTRLKSVARHAHERRAVQVAAHKRAAEAAAVREYALRYREIDPRFVADLLAAADRHEAGR